MKFKAPLLFASLTLCLTAAFLPNDAHAAEGKVYQSDKNYDELTPAEKTAAKNAAKTKKLEVLRACADPGNMPLSNMKGEGFENKIVEVLAKAMGTRVSYFYRPYLERGLTRDTFGNDECDILLDMPADYEGLLTTVPIYRSTYVLAYRDDAGFTIKDFDDPKLRELRLGTFQHSGIRVVLANHGITENVKIHIISHDADLEPEKQPWRQVQEVIDGNLDIAAVWGPFAGFLKTMHNQPLTIQPVNLMEDKIPLEFDMAIGMPKNSVVLKYMLDNALEKSKDEIKQILTDYGVPLVQCSRCVVSGDITSHGSFFIQMQEQARKQFTEPLPDKQTQIDKDKATPDQIVSNERLEDWLKDGSNLDQELANAVLASDRGRVAFLLDKGADINKANPQGLPALHAAARQRDSETIELLIGKGADVNGRDTDGWTPIMHAAFRNHAPSIAALAKAGANLEATAPGGFTPLSIAIEEGKFIAVKALLDAGTNVNTPAGNQKLTPLMLIASQPLVERRAASLNQGMSSVDIGRLLIAGGADVNAKSAKGVTPLMVAAAHDNPPLIGLLIQAGADGDAKTPDGKTALDIAKSNLNEAAAQQIELLARQSKRQGAMRENPPAGSPESTAGQ